MLIEMNVIQAYFMMLIRN